MVAFELIDPSLTNVENARRLGTSEASIRRAKQRAANAPTNPTPTGTLVGASLRDPDTGSWYRYRMDDSPDTTTLDVADLEAAIAGYTPPSASPASPANPALVVCASDWQVGKTDMNGGTKGTVRRVLDAFHKAAQRAEELRPAEIVLADLGDVIENECNTVSQRATNDLDLTSQVRLARRLMLEGIKLLAPHTPRLTYVAVPSNHAAVRTGVGSKNLASTVQNDWGLEIQEQIRDVCTNSDTILRDVNFVSPQHHLESVVYNVCNTNIGFLHGHQTRNPDKIGDWWKGQSHGRGPVGEADILLLGHWHSLRVQLSGDSRTFMVAPTSDPGSSWFTGTAGDWSKPGMLTFTVNDGGWDLLRVL